MNNSWFIGDLHLGHNGIIGFCRPQFKDIKDHNESIIELINTRVKPKDTLWILGDVAFGRDALQYVKYINCDKINLVMGNHDEARIMDYVDVGFNKIGGMIEHHEFILTHAPIHPAQLGRYPYNIHGHMHLQDIDDDRYINVNADRINLIPKNLLEIRYEINERKRNKKEN